MNIWALDKHDSIRCLLLMLQQSFGAEQVRILESGCLHPKAVRIGEQHSPATAYLYTYAHDEGRYGLHLEYPYLPERNLTELEDMYEDLEYDSVVAMLQVHFQWQLKQA